MTDDDPVTHSFLQRAFPHATVIPHVDPNRFTIDLLGETRPRLPMGDGLHNLGLVLAVAAVVEVCERAVLEALR